MGIAKIIIDGNDNYIEGITFAAAYQFPGTVEKMKLEVLVGEDFFKLPGNIQIFLINGAVEKPLTAFSFVGWNHPRRRFVDRTLVHTYSLGDDNAYAPLSDISDPDAYKSA
jgi:hypothetical protein